MDHKLPLTDRSVGGEGQNLALAEALFAAINEHELTLMRVSRLLHDDVSQVLSAAGLQLDALRMDFGETAAGVDQRAVEIQSMLEQAINRLRDISNELNPSIAERAGLHFALDQMLEKARKTFPGALRLHFDSSARVTPTQARTFCKIADYALEVAMTRSGCSLIDMQFKQSQGKLILDLADNGTFEAPDSARKPLGTLLIEYYAARAHFDLARSGSPGNTLRVSCPAGNTE